MFCRLVLKLSVHSKYRSLTIHSWFERFSLGLRGSKLWSRHLLLLVFSNNEFRRVTNEFLRVTLCHSLFFLPPSIPFLMEFYSTCSFVYCLLQVLSATNWSMKVLSATVALFFTISLQWNWNLMFFFSFLLRSHFLWNSIPRVPSYIVFCKHESTVRYWSMKVLSATEAWKYCPLLKHESTVRYGSSGVYDFFTIIIRLERWHRPTTVLLFMFMFIFLFHLFKN